MTHQAPVHHTRATVPGVLAQPQPTVAQLCTSGYTATIRPPQSYTTSLKIQQLKALKYKDQNPAHYEEDHKIPLSVGGAPSDPNNLWPEVWADAHAKDAYELNYYHAMCSGRITLQKAQSVFLGDWWRFKSNP